VIFLILRKLLLEPRFSRGKKDSLSLGEGEEGFEVAGGEFLMSTSIRTGKGDRGKGAFFRGGKKGFWVAGRRGGFYFHRERKRITVRE